MSPKRLLDEIPSLRTLSTHRPVNLDLNTDERKTWNNIRVFRPARILVNDDPLQILNCFPNLEGLKATWGYDRTPLVIGQFGQQSNHNDNNNFYDKNRPETWLNAESTLGTTPTCLQRLTLALTEKSLLVLPSPIPWCSHLVELNIPILDLHVATAVATHCPSLQVFQQYNKPRTLIENLIPSTRPDVNIASILFSSCRHLQVFDRIQHTIEIDRLRDQPWICPNLEVLRCQFVRFERLKMEEQLLVASALCSPELINEDLTPLHQRYERSKSQHQLFFGTLAKLQNLRVLNLGQYSLDVFYVSSKYSNPYESGAHQVRVVLDSPSLTLYDGFDQLSTLRELEYLDFEGVDLRMSMQGIAWIATHWRKLKKVFGFQIAFNQYGYDWNADHKRTFLRENLKRLRSEIQLHDDVAVGCRLFRTNNASQENW